MRLKSYFVHSTDEAMKMAKIELGDQATLVDAQALAEPAGGRSRFEVIFAAPAAAGAAPAGKRPTIMMPSHAAAASAGGGIVAPGQVAAANWPSAPMPPQPIPGWQSFTSPMTTLHATLPNPTGARPLSSYSPAVHVAGVLRGRLLQADLPPTVIETILQAVPGQLEKAALNGQESSDAEETLAGHLSRTIRTAATPPAPSQRKVVFVGPCGVGKTTTLARLAFRQGVERYHSVMVISYDNLEIGASDRLGRLCSLIGVPFRAAEHAAALHAAIHAGRARNWMFIDTPGYSPQDKDLLEDTATLLNKIPGTERHLVLPAHYRLRDLIRRFRQYSPFDLSGLVFTHLDETEQFGPMWALAQETGLGVSWLSSESRIPEDIEDADLQRIAALVVGTAPGAAPFRPTFDPVGTRYTAAGSGNAIRG